MDRLRRTMGKTASSAALLALAEVAQACAPVAREMHAVTPRATSTEQASAHSAAEEQLEDAYGSEWVRAEAETVIRRHQREQVGKLTEKPRMTGWDRTGVADERVREVLLDHLPSAWSQTPLSEFSLQAPTSSNIDWRVRADRDRKGYPLIQITDVPANVEMDTDRDYAWVLRDAPILALARLHEPLNGEGYTKEQRVELVERAHKIFHAKKHPVFVETDRAGQNEGSKLLDLRMYMARLLSVGVGFTGSEKVTTEAEWKTALARDFVTTYGAEPILADDSVQWILDTLHAESPNTAPWKENRMHREGVVQLAHEMQEHDFVNGLAATGSLKDVAKALAVFDVPAVSSNALAHLPPMSELPHASEAASRILDQWVEVVTRRIAMVQMDGGKIPTKVFSGSPVTASSVDAAVKTLNPKEAEHVVQAIKQWTSRTFTHLQKL